MVNKLELNNEVSTALNQRNPFIQHTHLQLITLRKQFAKAKARAINKLTRKLKVVEHGKTKDPSNKKLDSKTAKLVEELKILKVSGVALLV